MVVYQSNGTSQTESFRYNTLGQLTRAQGRGADTSYNYSATANDGRITSRTDNLSGEEVTYKYDELGRLAEAATVGPEWGLSWRYDGFGNRLEQNVTKGTPRTASFAVDPATNRLTGGGFAYDANGNMLNLGTGSGTARYDVDNRMVWVSTNNGIETYGYSAANQRIQVTRPNGTVETFFYGLGGELLGVYQRGTRANGHYYFSSASIRVRFAGRLIDGPGGSMVTDRLGSVVKNGTEALSYYPYGELKSGNTSGDREKFATYTRDAVSGLDYAMNRYYSPQLGRFTSADPYQASERAANPITWNRYSYVSGDPVGLADPQGLLAVPSDEAYDGASDGGPAGRLFSQSIMGALAMIATKEHCYEALNATSIQQAVAKAHSLTYVFTDLGNLSAKVNPDGSYTPDDEPPIGRYDARSRFSIFRHSQIIFNSSKSLNWDDLTQATYYLDDGTTRPVNLLRDEAIRTIGEGASPLTPIQFMQLLILHEIAHSLGKEHPGNAPAVVAKYQHEIWEKCFQ